METIDIPTCCREELVDITGTIQQRIREKGWINGALVVFCPHTTAAITINEGADPDVVRDIITTMRALVPQQKGYLHAEGNSDAHIKSSMFGCNQMIIVDNGQLLLGTWQKIYFCEFDGPRRRKAWLSFLGQA